MKILKPCLVGLAGFVLGAWLCRAPATQAASAAVYVDSVPIVASHQMSKAAIDYLKSLGYPVTAEEARGALAGQTSVRGSQIVGFSCVDNGGSKTAQGAATCYVASR